MGKSTLMTRKRLIATFHLTDHLNVVTSVPMFKSLFPCRGNTPLFIRAKGVRSLFLTLAFPCLLILPANAQRLNLPNPANPAPAKAAELYSWRTPEGAIVFGLRSSSDDPTAEILMRDQKIQLKTQAELGQALERISPGTELVWHYLNVKGKATRPAEDIEAATKETAFKAKVTLVLWDDKNLEPEYWKQPRGKYEDALKKLAAATDDDDRMQALRTACKEAFSLGLYPEAKKYATDLEALLPKVKENWNYGDAVQECNIVLGRVAVIDGDLDTARGCLLGAGYSPGSPVMNTMGPDMTLARDLLAKGDRKIVIQYLDLCRNFWNTNHGLIDQWTLQIKNGQTPDFGTNIRD